MADINIGVLLPQIETSNSTNKQSVEFAASGEGTLAAITTSNTDVYVAKAMANKNNSMFIVVNVATAGSLTIKAGNAYPNSTLGDYTKSLSTGLSVIQLEDISRFETRDEKIKIVGDGTLVANLIVIGKRVGVDTVANQNARDVAAGRTLHYKASYTG